MKLKPSYDPQQTWLFNTIPARATKHTDRYWTVAYKLAFHDADTDTDTDIDTDILADIFARIVARMSACR